MPLFKLILLYVLSGGRRRDLRSNIIPRGRCRRDEKSLHWGFGGNAAIGLAGVVLIA
jgi:hypothetical protein